MAVAGARDPPQGGPYRIQRAGFDGRRPGLHVCDEFRPTVRMAGRGASRPVRTNEAAHRRGPLHPGRRHVGGIRQHDSFRRIIGAADHVRPPIFQGASRRHAAWHLATGQFRLHRLLAADRPPCRIRLVPHAEDLVERHHQVPAPLVHVGGHRWHAYSHALPALGYLLLVDEHARADVFAAQLPGQGPLP